MGGSRALRARNGEWPRLHGVCDVKLGMKMREGMRGNGTESAAAFAVAVRTSQRRARAMKTALQAALSRLCAEGQRCSPRLLDVEPSRLCVHVVEQHDARDVAQHLELALPQRRHEPSPLRAARRAVDVRGNDAGGGQQRGQPSRLGHTRAKRNGWETAAVGHPRLHRLVQAALGGRGEGGGRRVPARRAAALLGLHAFRTGGAKDGGRHEHGARNQLAHLRKNNKDRDKSEAGQPARYSGAGRGCRTVGGGAARKARAIEPFEGTASAFWMTRRRPDSTRMRASTNARMLGVRHQKVQTKSVHVVKGSALALRHTGQTQKR
eukprot:2216960-Pleurochrysis_carterae.AAC.1